MKTLNLNLSGTQVSLRLTAANLAEYAAACGNSGNVLFTILDAIDNLQRQAELFKAALNWPENGNSIHDGYELIDLLNDSEYSPEARNALVLDLAVHSGVINRDNAAKVSAAIHSGTDKIIDTAVSLLSGSAADIPTATVADASAEENPT